MFSADQRHGPIHGPKQIPYLHVLILFCIPPGVLILGIIAFEQNQVQNPADATLVRCLAYVVEDYAEFHACRSDM